MGLIISQAYENQGFKKKKDYENQYITGKSIFYLFLYSYLFGNNQFKKNTQRHAFTIIETKK